MIFNAAGVILDCVMYMPPEKLLALMCCANWRICLMPIEGSTAKSTQMVPICGRGCASAFVGRGVYFSSMAVVGLKEVFIRARLDIGC